MNTTTTTMIHTLRRFNPTRIACGMAVLAATQLLSGCLPLVVGGAVMSGMVAVDRRTSGTQLEDQSIELKGNKRAYEVAGDRAHVNITSYNRVVLLTGEATTEADRAAIEHAVKQIENVRTVVNELEVVALSSMGTRSNDTVLTSKVKASFVDAADLQVNAYKVVTERSVVYLMGHVTEREAARAADVARGVAGVKKVVRVFDMISETELANLRAPAK